MKRICLPAVLLLSAWSALVAKTVDLPGEGASVDVPDAWASQAQPAPSLAAKSVLILSAVNAERTSLLQIEVCSNPNGVIAGWPALVTNIKDALANPIVAHGGQVQFTGEGNVTLHDVPAYLVQYTATLPGGRKPEMVRNYQVAANGKLYLVTLRTLDPAADVDLQGIATSFRFATPPVLPTPPISHRRLKIALAAGGGVILLAILGGGVYFYRRRQLDE